MSKTDNSVKKPLKKRFLGKVGNKLSDFADKQEMMFEKAHLRAYLKGRDVFHFGFSEDPVTGVKFPQKHQVKYEYYTED